VDLRVRCPDQGCLSAFKYPKALANHRHLKHGHSDLTKLISEAKNLFDDKAKKEYQIQAQESPTREVRADLRPEEILQLIESGEDPILHLVLFDLETTGLEREAQMVSMSFLNMTSGEKMTKIICPDAPIHPQASAINGFHNFDPRFQAPGNLQQSLLSLIHWLELQKRTEGDSFLFLAHNGERFDNEILKRQFEKAILDIPETWQFGDPSQSFKTSSKISQATQ